MAISIPKTFRFRFLVLFGNNFSFYVQKVVQVSVGNEIIRKDLKSITELDEFRLCWSGGRFYASIVVHTMYTRFIAYCTFGDWRTYVTATGKSVRFI